MLMQLGQLVRMIDFASDTPRLAALTADGVVHVIDHSTGTVLQRIAPVAARPASGRGLGTKVAGLDCDCC